MSRASLVFTLFAGLPAVVTERWRINGPLSNIPAFARAFGCKEGDPMVRPKDKVPSIW